MFHVKHLANRESFIRGIVRSSVLNTVSKFILFATSLILAKYFGAGIKTDIYFFLYSTLWLLITVFSSVHVAVIIPQAMREKEINGEKQAMRFFTFFFYAFMGGALFIMALFLINPVMWVSWVSKYDITVLESYRGMIIGFAPLFPLILITQYLLDVLNAYRYFTLPVLTGIINNVLAFLLLYLFHDVFDIYSMLLAIYLGYFLNFLHLILVMKRDLKWDFTPRNVHLKQNFKENFSVVLFGNFWGLLGKYATNYFLSSSLNGLLTAYTYGQKLTNVPTEAITNQFSSVSAIRLNELAAQNDSEKLKQVFLRLCNMLIFILVPIAALFYFYADDIVSFFYQRGEFNTQDVKNTAFFMRYLGFLLPIYAISNMVTRLYNAYQIVKFSTIYSIISNILMVCFLWIAFSNWGIWGIPFALLAQNLLNIIVAQLFIRYFFKNIAYEHVLLKFMLFTIGCMSLAYGIHRLFANLTWPGIVNAIAGSMLFCVVYLAINEVFKINVDVSEQIKARIRRLSF